jgi:hypothetical protein
MRHKSIAVQSNIDGLLLDKAVEYFGEEAERKWVTLAHSIQSPTSLGKSFKQLEADLEWTDCRQQLTFGFCSSEKVAAPGRSQHQRSIRLSALLEERVASLKAEFDAQLQDMRSENAELQVQLRKAEDQAGVHEERHQAECASLRGRIEELCARNTALGEQLKSTLALHAASPAKTEANGHAPEHLQPEQKLCPSAATCGDAGSLLGKQMSQLKQVDAAEVNLLRSRCDSLIEQLENKSFLLERKDQLLRCSRQAPLDEQLEAMKSTHAIELRTLEL